ncbi:MAG: hypothetical protein JO254_11580, partial [Pseudolabrys sp.]|nr:hypothetical protein [Pseudolabrys sp.]
MAWRAPAHADTVETLCGSASFSPVANNAAVSDAATKAERALSRRAISDPADSVLSGLDAPLAGHVAPDAAAMAEYCAAAGETMRVARSGSQYQAQRYLVSAVIYADAAGDNATVARAAYRLGLATAGTGAEGTRGAKRAMAADTAPAAGATGAQGSEASGANDHCAGLHNSRI